MSFELFAGNLINLDRVEYIYCHTDSDKITKEYDEEKQEVKTQIEGNPFQIVIMMANQTTTVLGYATQAQRDSKFRHLAKALGATDE